MRKYGISRYEFPCHATFKRRLEREVPEQSIYLARYGESAWNRKYGNYIDRDYSTVICGEAWVSDHAQIDVACLNSDGSVVFPWVTAWRDYKSGKWLGWILQCGHPNSDHIFQSFYYAVEEKYGLPKDVIIDNGKDYRSKDFAGGRKFKIEADEFKTTCMLEELNVKANFALPYNAQTKPIAKSTISMWMNGNYNGKNDKITDAINNFIQREHERSGNSDLPFVDISTVKYITEIGRLCHTQGKIGVCVGKAGLGKTVAVKRYTKEFMDSILIESDSGYTAKSLLKEIHRRLGLSGKGSVYDLMDEVVRKLNQSGRLLIIDEAENLPYRALEITRRIHDKTGVGILLVGRGILLENLKGYNNQYDQLYSRVKFTKIIDKILIQDVIKILESIGQNTKLAETYLQYSDGNTRRLEHLISHSISIAKFNGKAEVDDAVIKQTSKLLMA